MKKPFSSEKLIIEAISKSSRKAKKSCKGLSIGSLIRMIRLQLGMPQKILAKRASLQQATISKIEKGLLSPNTIILKRIFDAISCDLVISFILQESIENQRLRQAKKIAKKHLQYLQGTMSLEKQSVDPQMMKEMLRQEEIELLHGPKTKLWEE